MTIARIEGHNDDAGWKLMYVDVHFPRKFILKVPTVNEATNTSSRITYFHKWSSVAKNQSSRKLARPYAGYFYFGRNHGCNTQWLENLSKSLILQHCERSELEIVFCLRNGASFGKSQLLNWANFGKSKQTKKWRENSNVIWILTPKFFLQFWLFLIQKFKWDFFGSFSTKSIVGGIFDQISLCVF